MASGSMTAVELFGKVVGEEHPDLLKEAMRQVFHELMAQEVSAPMIDSPKTPMRTPHLM